MVQYVIPEYVTGEDIKRVRNKHNMTQKEFADFAKCSTRTVERWESQDDRITGPIVTLIDLLMRDDTLFQKLKIDDEEYKLRLLYMYHNMVCTIIDVDDVERKVRIHNYIDNPLYRAFGVNTEPSYEDYEEFLESRCFPRSRDKLKLELKRLDIPFYDPFMIIEKTEGRMAEDDFWIKIENK